MAARWLGVFLGFVAGAALGLAVGLATDSTVVPDAGGPAAGAGGGASSSEGASADRTSPSAGTSDAERRTRTSPGRTGGGAAEVEALVAAVGDPDALPESRGEIRGTCRTADGKPLADVRIVLFATPPRAIEDSVRTARPGESVPLEDQLRAVVRRHRWTERTRHRATSGADGTFVFPDVPDLPFVASAESERYRFQNPGPVRIGDALSIVATADVPVRLDVRLPDGTQPRQAMIRLEQRNSSSGTNWRPDTPFFVAPGSWTISATAGSGTDTGPSDEYASPKVPLVIGTDPPAEPVVLQLAGRPGIRVSARPATGFEALRAEFFVAAVEGEEPDDAALRVAGRPTQFRGGRSGTMPYPSSGPALPKGMTGTQWRDLTPGRYVVGAGYPGGPLARRTVEVGSAVTEVALDLLPPAPDTLFEARVVLPDGTPAGAATFTWERRGKSFHETYMDAGSIVRGGGAWTLLRPTPGASMSSSSRWGATAKDDTGEWTLRVNAGTALGSFPANGSGGEFRLLAPGTLRVTLSGPGAQGRARRFSLGISKVTNDPNAAMRGASWGDTPVDGPAPTVLGPVEPGEYDLVLRLQREMMPGSSLVTRRLTVQAGEQSVTLDVPALHKFSVEAGKPRAGENVWLMARSADGSTTETSQYVTLDAEGRATMDDVPGGEYQLQLGQESFTIRIPETTVFRP